MGCGDSSGPVNVNQVVVTPGTYTLAALGVTHQFSAVARDLGGGTVAEVTFTWSSSDSDVATVDENGLATAVGNGATTITASVQGVSGDATLQVTQAVSGVEVNPDEFLLIELGSTYPFSAEAKDANNRSISGKTILWSSSNESVATVNAATGLVTAVGPGDATITATADQVDGTAALIVEVFTQVSAGGYHTVALTSRGSAYAWGRNDYGQLGDGTTLERHNLVPVAGGLTFDSLRAGYGNTCGVTPDGRAYCWGLNLYGQLGEGSTENRNQPTEVAGGLSWVSLDPGHSHTCGVLSNGGALCWGRNSHGQLGDQSTTDTNTPQVVFGGYNWVSVSTGFSHTCGVTLNGPTYCWGDNVGGQIGDGTTNGDSIPVTVAGGQLTFAMVSANDCQCGFDRVTHNCGLTSDGTAYGWGYNYSGQLGDGTTIDRHGPVPAAGAHTFLAIGAGGGHSCGVTTDSVAYCWGANYSGQLGVGSTDEKHAPELVSVNLRLSDISLGEAHTCGLTTTGAVYCWGRNNNGQLGDGSTTDRNTPVRVVPQ
jgi:alpha-tubulin suppressor-like RCC1 family protein